MLGIYGCRYREKCNKSFELTLVSDIENYNFGRVGKGQFLGWSGRKQLDFIQALNAKASENIICELFDLIEDQLITKVDLYLFMITKNADIAQSDCLFYAVKA